MSQPTDLERGAFAGKETYLYYNSGTYAAPTWVEIERARNVQRSEGPELSKIPFHGAGQTGAIPGYVEFAGSFEYVPRKGTDTVFAALETCQQSGGIMDVIHLDGPITDSGVSKGWRAPILLGKFSRTSNGSDGVVESIPFEKADCYTTAGVAVEKVPYTAP